MKRRILATIPIISLMLFLVGVYYLDNTALGFTAFLLIPLSWVLLSGNALKKINEVIPFICLIVFLWLGFGLGLWHPGWLIFLLVPVVNLITERPIPPRKIVGMIVTAAYIGLSLWLDQWHPTWIIFLLIPIINTLFFPQKNAYVSFSGSSFKDKFRNIIIEHEKVDDDDDW
jgi:hypothetical protein